MEAMFTLTASESKRLIAKAVASLPEVREAQENGYLLIGRGSTNAYILEELLEAPVEKERFVAGQTIRGGVLCALSQDLRSKPITFHKGKALEIDPGTVIDKIGPGDIFIKGGNAVDADRNVGVLMASPVGGTMGQFYMMAKAQGMTSIYAVGLEKMVGSVVEAAHYGGRLALEKTLGAAVGMACVADGWVITETEALEELFDVTAVHFASGGWGGAEGSVTLVVEGDPEAVDACMVMIESIKGEPPLNAVKGPCKTCPMRCFFQGKEEAALPAYLRG